ncbi:hypothetical protein E3N88_33172 [Mikania micrantha]|uniref:Uncharacterized protein n=1 Tax=Mikania micrantha TaxID=192012 RepID=A0A5N6MB25_9ASTR|nr:hypothetical protein E3N88_33172 [Mikania micrantha]
MRVISSEPMSYSAKVRQQKFEGSVIYGAAGFGQGLGPQVRRRVEFMHRNPPIQYNKTKVQKWRLRIVVTSGSKSPPSKPPSSNHVNATVEDIDCRPLSQGSSNREAIDRNHFDCHPLSQ